MKAQTHAHTDEDLMRLALNEAHKKTRLDVYPNPRVGAALLSVKGELLAAHHTRAGQAHAERELFKLAEAQGIQTEGATVAVTLEPCCHHGRTPPCTEILLEKKVARVLVGGQDPFPEVQGRGIERLRQAGIEVQEGLLAAECEAVNREWLFAQRHRRPFLRLKMATSLDGLWTSARGHSQWITGAGARARAHQMRAEADALLTGAGTVRADNPSMTARSANGELLARQPKVYVLNREIPLTLKNRRLEAHPGGARSVVVTDLNAFLCELFENGGHHSVMLEAGPILSSSFLEAGLFQEILVFMGPRFLGGEGRRLEALKGGELPGLKVKNQGVELFPEGDLLLKFCPSD